MEIDMLPSLTNESLSLSPFSAKNVCLPVLLFNSSACAVARATSASPSFRHIRNMTVGILGLWANLAAIWVLVRAKKIKKTLKIYLTSLVVNDIIFMAALTIPMWNVTSRDLACYLIAHGSVSPFAISSLLTALISFHNYQGVFNAWNFQTALSTRRVLLTVLAVWLVGWTLSLMCLGFIPTPPGDCRPTLQLPKFAYLYSVSLNGVSNVCILVLNFRVVCFLASNRSISRVSSLPPLCASGGGSHIKLASSGDTRIKFHSSASTSKETHIMCSNNSAIVCNRQIPQSIDLSSKKDTSSGNSEFTAACLCSVLSLCRLNRNQICLTAQKSKLKQVILSHGDLYIGSSSPGSSHALTTQKISAHLLDVPLTFSQEFQQEPVTNTDIGLVQGTCSDTCIETGQTAVIRTQRRHKQDLPRTGTRPSLRCLKMRRLSLTLCLVTLWSCTLHLPNLIYTCLSVSLDSADRHQLDNSGFNLVSTTLVFVNSLSNPLLYAWRFTSCSRLFGSRRPC